MKYNSSTIPIPQDKRQQINDTILQIIDSGTLPDGITHEDIYNGYTGVGGLHGLSRNDFDNYYEFSEGKKEIEQGQFLTPGTIVGNIAQLLHVQDSDLVCDLTCGAGAFFNFFKEMQCYGCDIDQRAIKVAKFLYPNANIDVRDIRYFEPDVKFDYVVGNPPFNLRWDIKVDLTASRDAVIQPAMPSQQYFCLKAAELLKPGGILCCVVPDSFLKDEFFNKGMIDSIDEQFNFLFQYKLENTAFRPMGVNIFDTKVVCFQRKAAALTPVPYNGNYVTYEEAVALMQGNKEQTSKLKAKLRGEQALAYAHDHRFNHLMKKYIFEIKTHRILRPYLSKALAHVDKLYTQKQPKDMKYEEWEKAKLTPNKVLSYLRAIIDKQHEKPRDEYKLVQTSYGLKIKAYSDKAAVRVRKNYDTNTSWSYNDLIRNGDWQRYVPVRIPKGISRLLRLKQIAWERQTNQWADMVRDDKIDTYLNRFGFRNMKYDVCRFNDFQKEDLGLMLQKDYGILNWQQGSGKTPAAAAWCGYKKQRNTFICGPAVAINMTWTKFMKIHNKEYVNIQSLKDVYKIKPGMFVLMSLDYAIKYERQLKKYIKMQSQKVNLVFDESDEITNAAAKRTRAMLNIFRRVKRKLLTTGTTTRNNINELYSQLELLYNNSLNLMCTVSHYWVEETVKKKDTLYPEMAGTGLKQKDNPYYNYPFPPFYGSTVFKRCFNPAKTTVFGIQQHNQDLYNQDALRSILGYTIRTRKFRQIAGDKYTVHTVRVNQNPAEEEVYRMIIEELNVLLPAYFVSTGNSRKDAMLKIIRQLQLLIEATSTPHLFKEYEGTETIGKAEKIFEMCDEWNEKIAIGCTTLKGTEWYYEQLRKRYPSRSIFKVIGEVSFNGRDKIRAAFESTHTGILVCTQQSLKSSVNIPTCNKVIIESMQWNIPKIEQFFFRFIRYDSKDNTDVTFLNYNNTIEINLMALLMSKEKLNDFIKTLEYKENSDIYDDYGVDLDILNSILTKEEDSEGKIRIAWGKAQAV